MARKPKQPPAKPKCPTMKSLEQRIAALEQKVTMLEMFQYASSQSTTPPRWWEIPHVIWMGQGLTYGSVYG